jgi:RNA polymerase sigma factor (sigma-70 family)
MYPRNDVIEIFSTFAQFEANQFQKWTVDPKLRRNMQSHVTEVSKSNAKPVSGAFLTESFWALYWYKRWQTQSQPLPMLHLSAYLQESCYWVAQQAVKKFEGIQYSLPDYFQIAIADITTILKSYNPDKGASLKTYAALALPSLLRDMLRLRHEIDICTNWTLLRKISKKRLLEALQHAGLSADTIQHYRLAWMCFKAVYVPTTATNKLPKVDRALWQAIATLYNAERKTQLVASGSECSPETIETWLNHCSTWIRAYLYPPVASLNAPAFEQGSDDVQTQIADLSPDLTSETLLDALIAQEDQQTRQGQQSQVSTLLTTAIAQLDAESQTLMRLYYQDGLTQQQIARHVSMSQVTVSRRLTKAREALLTALVQWSQTTLNRPPTSTLIKDMSMALEEWLKTQQRIGVNEGALTPSPSNS